MSTTTVSSVGKYPQSLIDRNCDWIGKTWKVLPRCATCFLPIVPDLIDARDSLYANEVHLSRNGREELQQKLITAHERAVAEKIWGLDTPGFNKSFFDLYLPGRKEGYLAVQLASIIACNLENPPKVYCTSHYQTPDKLQEAVAKYEKKSTRYWLQRAWQARFQDISPGTNTSLRWDETAQAIQDAVREVIQDKKLEDIQNQDLDNLRRNIHDKMRERKLWKNDQTGIVEHDVIFDQVGYEPQHDGQKFGTSFMQDNYTIMALIGLIPKSEYVAKETSIRNRI